MADPSPTSSLSSSGASGGYSTSAPSYTIEGLLKRLQELQRELEEERGKNHKLDKLATPEPMRRAMPPPSPSTHSLTSTGSGTGQSPDRAAKGDGSDGDVSHQLQEQVAQLRREKVALENQLEQESEYVVNKLAKEKEAALQKVNKEKDRALQSISKEREKVVRELNQEKEQLVHDKEKLQKQLRNVAPEAAGRLLHELSSEVLRLRQLLISTGHAENEAELDLAAELERVRQENRQLCRRVSELSARVHELQDLSMEQDRQAEIDEERMFNFSRASLSGLATPPRTVTPLLHGSSSGPRERERERDFPLSASPATSRWHSPQPHGRTFSFGSLSRSRSASINSETGHAGGPPALPVGGPHTIVGGPHTIVGGTHTREETQSLPAKQTHT